MKRIYSSADAMQCGMLVALLEARGIECLVRNSYLSGAIGELPLNEAWPEIWVVEDRDAAPALRLINDAIAPADDRGAWRCPACGEAVDGEFSQCWSCGEVAPRDDVEAPPGPADDG